MKKYGFLREDEKAAFKAGIDKDTGLPRTSLLEYLHIIFPKVNDWVHDKSIPKQFTNNISFRNRPDYRSETLKMIVEFDGIHHYTNPDIIIKDIYNTNLYKKFGYKVIRIPYFIQLTKEAIKILFQKELHQELFPDNIASLTYKCRNTPAYLCLTGIERMKQELLKFPIQRQVNIDYLKSENNFELTRYDLL